MLASSDRFLRDGVGPREGNHFCPVDDEKATHMADGVNCSSLRISSQSPAKINWTLAVDRRRPDGFHEIRSLVSQITLYDELLFEAAECPGLALICDWAEVPTDRTNLVWRAAELLALRAERRLALKCSLTKRIPMGGGLGGGSSNGAAALVALNRLWGLDWSKEQLGELAAELGSDVALFLESGSAVIGGRGEHVSSVSLGWRGWIVLIIPGLHVSTADVYRAWQPPGGEVPSVEPDKGLRAEALMGQTFNMLEAPAIQVCPELGRIQRAATDSAGRPVRISGSGSTLFTAFDDHDEAMDCARSISALLKIQTEVVQPVEEA